jgi:D-xylose 1-dehydrogenase (NADP+, D-xylono-1,5-lactone-forming)
VGLGAVRWGVLSTARINRLVLAGARRSDRVEVVAIASRDLARAQSFAREHGIERAHGSYEGLLEDPEVEAVYVPLPNALHVEWSLRALEAGKHVLCEKPLTRRPAEIDGLFDAAERADRLVMEAFMYRHHPQTRRLEELVEQGAIGQLRVVRSAFSFSLTRLADVRLSHELDGGSLMDVGCYCVSGSRLLAGEPEHVEAQRVAAASGVDVRFTATMRFPGDVLAHFDCGFDLPDRSALEAVGSDGSLLVADPWHCRRPEIELHRDDGVERIAVEPADSYQLELENLSDAVRGATAPLLGRDDALGQARALEALHRAAAP